MLPSRRDTLASVVSMLYRIGALGARPEDTEEQRLEQRFLIWMGLFMSVGGLFWGTLALATGLGATSTIPYGYVLLTVCNLSFFAYTHRFAPTRRFQVAISLLLPFVFQAVLGGFVNSGAVMLWSLLALVGALTFSELRETLTWLLLFLALTLFSGLIEPHVRDLSVPPDGVRTLFFVSNVSAISSIVFGLTLYVLSVRRADNLALLDANETVSALNQELEEQVARAEEAERKERAANIAKSAFLANMSHELRTPLNAIIGYAELLQEEASEADVEDLKRIEVAGAHLLQMINDVLDLAKIEAGRMQVSLHVVDLPALLDEVLATLEPLVGRNGNRLLVERAGLTADTFVSDGMKIKQILVNLLGNATKFTSQGTITVRFLLAGRVLRIEVEDTGIGMTAEQLSRVAKPFEQADGSTTRRYGGSGLGLYLISEYASMLGSKLVLSSEFGRGTKASVTIESV